MDRRTVAVYDENSDHWIAQKERPLPVTLAPFVHRAPRGVRADIGCGPGWHSAHLGAPVVAMDAAPAMVAHVARYSPDALRVVGDLEFLPFRAGALSGAWAHKSYMHIAGPRVPMALAELHQAVALGGAVHFHVTCDQLAPEWDDPFAGRHFTHFSTSRFRELVEHAGFDVLSSGDDGAEWIDVEATRARVLPDTIGPDMRVLLVGLNPSVYSADAGVGFARPGNRFWPAALASRLVTRRLDPFHALRVDGVGMTNLVRRATVRADELRRDEYRAGIDRLARVVAWLEPRVVCFVGVTGYRIAKDRNAQVGWQPELFAGVRAYVMPNTSGLNAHAKPADFAAHLRAVQHPPDAT